ncbi:unnamed protein product [Owenia fusiformis]|uniref:Proteasome assembly chaperone 2 n=1 Tax=Owenia fusiformis TaxID=6347 RepID=A0A8J1XT12_OWEFU|nr:unnamed protein product [Owenia fusiformis]
MFISCEKTSPDLKAYTLVVPCVSVGNVGQLAVDLIISTLCMKKIGYMDDESILPLVGNDPFASGTTGNLCNLSVSCEVYMSVVHKVVAIQQRAPFVKGKAGAFRERLVRWIKDRGLNRVVIATSSHAYMMMDMQIQGGTLLRYLISPQLYEKGGESILKTLNWQEMEKQPVDPQGVMGNTDKETQMEIKIPGGGIGLKLYNDCCKEKIPTLLCSKFCSEGDNVADGIDVATYINSWFQWVTKKKKESLWRQPSSWKLQFGSNYDQTIYQ